MRSFILVAVLLQLAAIITHTTAYNFGDIIAFPRLCNSEKKPLYKHFAIYVGKVSDGNPDVGQGENEVFHQTGFCVFNTLRTARGWLSNTQEYKLNYMDDIVDLVAMDMTQDKIAERIREKKKMENCGLYNIKSNNCEHLATYVRYGVSNCYQLGARCSSCNFKQEVKIQPEVLADIKLDNECSPLEK